MTPINQIYKKVENLVIGVKQDLRSKGVVVPVKCKDGSLKFDNFVVVKNNNTFSILKNNDLVISEINLPQTAMLVANNLALGIIPDKKLLDLDHQYGTNTFEEKVYNRIINVAAKKQDWERVDVLRVKLNIAQVKAESARKSIAKSFEKLRQIR